MSDAFTYGYQYVPPATSPVKDPEDECPVTIDFACAFDEFDYGDTISSVTTVVITPGNGTSPDLTQVGVPRIVASPSTSVAAQAVAVTVANGVVGTIYSVTALVATTGGYQFRRSLFVPVQDL